MINAEIQMKVQELEMEQSNKMLEAMMTYAKMVFSSLVMVNGGAIIALLTFLGNAKSFRYFTDYWIGAIVAFCFGLFFVLGAMALAFLAQKIFREGTDRDIKRGVETDWPKKNFTGTRIRNVCVWCAGISMFFFATGAIMAAWALRVSFHAQQLCIWL